MIVDLVWLGFVAQTDDLGRVSFPALLAPNHYDRQNRLSVICGKIGISHFRLDLLLMRLSRRTMNALWLNYPESQLK